MKQSENIDQRFNNFETALESLELHLLQAVWNLERAVEIQIQENQKSNESLSKFIELISRREPKEFELARSHRQ